MGARGAGGVGSLRSFKIQKQSSLHERNTEATGARKTMPIVRGVVPKRSGSSLDFIIVVIIIAGVVKQEKR